MGHITTISFYNDGIENIKSNPEELAEAVHEACVGYSERKAKDGTTTFPLGNHCNMITAQKVRHMSDWACYVLSSGCLVDVSSIKDKESVFIDNAIDQLEGELRRLKKLRTLPKNCKA